MNRIFNIIFAGTPEFSATALDALIHSQHVIKAVYTQPDRPAGRGRKLTQSPVKQLALQHHLPVYQPATLRDTQEQQKIADLHADLMIVAAYGLILPLSVLQVPRWGCINIHASLLPRWRGAAPIQRAILAGDTETGVTIMQMDQGLDTGAILYQKSCSIGSDDNSAALLERLAKMGAAALSETLDNLDFVPPLPQDGSLATYAHKISKEEARLDWNLSAEELNRKVRAFNPWPVAFTFSGDSMIRIWEAHVLSQRVTQQRPGTILHVSAEGIDVAAGQDVLRIKTLQFPSGRALPAVDVLNARREECVVGKMWE